MGKHRAFAQDKGPFFLDKVVKASHVRGKQIRGELDSGECQVKAFGQGFCQHGLSGAGYIFQKDMALGQQGGEKQVYGMAVADDDLGNVLLYGLYQGGGFFFHGQGSFLWELAGVSPRDERVITYILPLHPRFHHTKVG